METILWTVLVLGVLVFVHELGHFIAAKAAGIQVPRFSIGLGPRLIGFRIGETDYCISAIPFGGYVKMAGMEGEEAVAGLEGDPLLREAEPEDYAVEAEGEARGRGAARSPTRSVAFDPSRGFDAKPLWVRLVVILAGVFMNFLFGFLVFVWVSYRQGEAITPAIVADVDPALVTLDSDLTALRRKEVTAVSGTAVSSWNDFIAKLEALSPTEPVRLTLATGEEVVLDGAVSGPELAHGLAVGLPPIVGEVHEGWPAAAAGIAVGDRILAVDQQPVDIWNDVPDYIRPRAGRRLTVRVLRDDTPGVAGGERILEIPVTPVLAQAPGEDNKFERLGHLGVGARVETRPISLLEAVEQGAMLTYSAGGLILGGLGQLLTGQISFKSLGGPVAIGQITGYYQRQGFTQLLYWMALFSINLAILNLLPIPVLDGGHVLFLLIEGVRGHPLSARSKVRLSQAGMVMLILLMAWAVTSDVLRLIEL